VANGTAPIYRSLHSAPLLGGIPAHYALSLVSVGALLGFGLMSVTKAGGLAIVFGVLVLWGVLALVFGQDRVAVPLFVLRRFHRFPCRIVSYSPSQQHVVIE
jgi:hypothetical protein